MAKTLVIKGADFSENALATVDFNVIPCTGISLNKATSSITVIGGSDTLVATLTPIDTTDTVQWGSSNNDVVTVNNGVITATGVGTATITATCGGFSATCTVTVTAIITGQGVKTASTGGDGTYTGGNGLGYINRTTNNYIKYYSVADISGTLSLHHYGYFAEDTYYPVLLPKGTKKLEISIGSNIEGFSVLLLSSTTPASGYPEVAQLVDKIGSASLVAVGGVITANIPSYDGYPEIDSVVICLRKTSNVEFTDADIATVSIVAKAA